MGYPYGLRRLARARRARGGSQRSIVPRGNYFARTTTAPAGFSLIT